MKTLRFLLRSVGPLALALAPLGLASAACNGALVATIHRALTVHGAGASLLLPFVGFGAGRVLSAYLSNVVLGNRVAKVVAAMRDEIVARLLRVPYRRVEQVGSARVLSALTQDVYLIEAAMTSVPQAVTHAATLLGGGLYLAYLSPLLFTSLSAVVVVCLLIFRGASRFARAAFQLQRRAYDRLWELYGSLTQGAKELKQHAPRRKSFLEGPLHETTQELLRHDVAMRTRFALSGAVNLTLVLAVLALVLFVFPESSALRAQVASGYVLVGLYLINPLASLARVWPLFRNAELAMQTLEALGVSLDDRDGEVASEAGAPASVSRIELSSAAFRYDDERQFALGPLSLHVAPSEIVFVVGGNGSGKTTLARVLIGLYAPSSGELRWDGQIVTAQTLDAYRQLWSVVFSDVHLFDRLYGIAPEKLDERAAALIAKLGLERIVSVRDGSFSTLELSQGQRKRLGLLVALLEDRPMCLFDEWAADQDPDWKRRFYRELLPELRARGKGVVVITHDDRYFDAADRVFVLRDGQLGASG